MTVKSIMATTHVNRKFMAFTREALEKAAEQLNSMGGTPLLLEHDRTRPAGWSKRAWVEELPDGHYSLVCESEIPETDEEYSELIRKYNKYIQNHLVQRVDPYRSYLNRFDGAKDPKLLTDQSCVYVQYEDVIFDVFPQLRNQIDADGLIYFSNLQPIGDGFIDYGEYVLAPHRFLRRSLSIHNILNSDFIGCICRISRQVDKPIALRIDPDIIGIKESLARYEELDYWWGPHFNKNLLNTQLGVTVHGADDKARLLSQLLRTEFFWYSRDRIRTLEIEEIHEQPILATNKRDIYVGERYIHSTIDETTGSIIHLDGAIRLYTPAQWKERIQPNITINKAPKPAGRVKLFRLDIGLTPNDWFSLIHTFFRSNPLIAEYFGLEGPNNSVK